MTTLRIAFVGSESSQTQCEVAAKRIRDVEIIRCNDPSDCATPNFAAACNAVVFDHREAANVESIRSLVEQRKHLLVSPAMWKEKSAAELLGIARQNHTILLPNRSWRFQPAAEAMKEQLDNDQLGAAGLLRIHRWLSCGAEQSLAESLLPDVDLACWLFNDEPNVLYATSRDDSSFGDTHSADPECSWRYVQVHFGFPNGGSAVIDCCLDLPAGDEYHSASLIGSRGAIYSDDHRDRQLLFGRDGVTAPKADYGHVAMAAQLRDFAHICRSGIFENITVQDEMDRVWRVLSRIDESIANRVSVAS
jgi:predicted dehydrogenase